MHIFFLLLALFMLRADDGGYLDPYGGGAMDPNGSRITTHAEEGPGMCPHGGRAPNVYSDAGSGIDPNG
jgi:hypothetical protein